MQMMYRRNFEDFLLGVVGLLVHANAQLLEKGTNVKCSTI